MSGEDQGATQSQPEEQIEAVAPSLPEVIKDKIYGYLRTCDDAKVYPQHTNRASELGHPCLRYLTYLRVAYKHKSPPEPELMLIFRDGRAHEKATLRLLEDSGLEVIEQQKPFDWPEYQITGHIDGKLLWVPPGEPQAQLLPIEIKSSHPYFYNGLKTAADLKTVSMFSEKWYAQIQLYCLMDNSEVALLIMKNKATGRLRFMEIPLDYEYAEGLIQKAETVNEYVDEVKSFMARTGQTLVSDPDVGVILPDRIEPDEKVCGYCPFIHICMGERKWEPKLLVMEDESLVKLLARRAELDDARTEFKHADEKAKQVLKNRADITKGERIIQVGDDWSCRVAWTRGDKPSQRVTITRVGEEVES